MLWKKIPKFSGKMEVGVLSSYKVNKPHNIKDNEATKNWFMAKSRQFIMLKRKIVCQLQKSKQTIQYLRNVIINTMMKFTIVTLKC